MDFVHIKADTEAIGVPGIVLARKKRTVFLCWDVFFGQARTKGRLKKKPTYSENQNSNDQSSDTENNTADTIRHTNLLATGHGYLVEVYHVRSDL
jgi:hypothetical protein